MSINTQAAVDQGAFVNQAAPAENLGSAWDGIERRFGNGERRNTSHDRRNEDRVANDADPRRNPDCWDRRG